MSNKEIDTSISVVRRPSALGNRGWLGRGGMTETLESSDKRVLKHTIRWFENALHPKPTVLLNVADILLSAFVGMTLSYTVHKVLLYTSLWTLGLLLIVMPVGLGLFFTLLAFRSVPYGGIFLIVRGFTICLGIVAMFL